MPNRVIGRSRRPGLAAAVLLALLSPACAPETPFSEQNARAHVNQMAGVIGSRPAGSDANRRAREYLLDQLRFYGYSVRVQEAEAQRQEFGLTAHVANIIATIAGRQADALGLVAHYDSRAEAPGAGDDALGVAVALECARLLAARRERQHSVMVLLTDAEEDGLMGAAALVRDPEVVARLRAYINLEAAGADGPVPLFETGPGNAWMVRAWARSAPAPRGGSYQSEVYHRLPNDTDFSVLKTISVPGLNFAATGDSYAYHTPRDTPDRLTSRAIEGMGSSALATALALDAVDLSRRSAGQAVYFDVGSARGIVMPAGVSRALGVLAIILATVGLVRTARVTSDAAGPGGVVRTFVWSILGLLLVGGSLVGITLLLREIREVYHPWYAHPARLWVLLTLTVVVCVEVLLRLGERLPAGWRAVRHPSAVWMVTQACWITLAVAAEALAPAAAYLWTVPLLVLGFVGAMAPRAQCVSARLSALAVLIAAGTLWLPEGREMLRFAVPMFGRLPLITPIAVYPGAVLLVALMVAPALLALDVAAPPHLSGPGLTLRTRRLRVLITPALLVALSWSFAACYLAEAYTPERPLQRVVHYVADHANGQATWEVWGNEPGLDLDLARGAPSGWVSAARSALPGLGGTAPPYPFAFRAPGRIEPAPMQATMQGRLAADGDMQVEIRAKPLEPGLTLLFAAPPGVVPRRASLPGVMRDGTWVARYAAAPPSGITFTAALPAAAATRLGEVRVGVITRSLPGGQGWLRQPSWLATARTVWHARSVHLLAPAAAPFQAPLR